MGRTSDNWRSEKKFCASTGNQTLASRYPNEYHTTRLLMTLDRCHISIFRQRQISKPKRRLDLSVSRKTPLFSLSSFMFFWFFFMFTFLIARETPQKTTECIAKLFSMQICVSLSFHWKGNSGGFRGRRGFSFPSSFSKYLPHRILINFNLEVNDPPPLVAKILLISCSFWENLAKSYVGAPPRGEILDQPLGKEVHYLLLLLCRLLSWILWRWIFFSSLWRRIPPHRRLVQSVRWGTTTVWVLAIQQGTNMALQRKYHRAK